MHLVNRSQGSLSKSSRTRLLTAIVSERVDARLARLLVGPLLVLGLGSVVWWHWTELRGHGDLRPYVLLQYGSLSVVLLLLFLYPAHYTGTAYLVAALGTYALAKGLEEADGAIFALGGIVSGHSLKHVAAAAAVACVVRMLRVRSPVHRVGLTTDPQNR